MMISSPNFYLKGLNHLHLSFSILSIWTPIIILVPQHMFIKIEAFVEYTGKLIFLQPCNLYCTLGNNKDNALPNLVDTMQYINVCLLELKFIIDVIQNIGIKYFPSLTRTNNTSKLSSFNKFATTTASYITHIQSIFFL